MPQTVLPSELLQTVPSSNGAFCGRFADLLKFPALFAALYQYERNEQGDITPDFCSDILACIASGVAPGDGGGGDDGGGGTGSGTLARPSVSATDGSFTEKIVVTWGAVAGATRYEVWRGLSSSVTAAAKLADVNLATSYTDQGSGVESGTVYWYFVRGLSDTASSAFSAGDSGYEGALLATLPMVTDLEVRKGGYAYLQGAVAGLGGIITPYYRGTCLLRWTPVAGAAGYDIYRNSVDDYTTATRIGTNLAFPAPRVDSFADNVFGPIINNGAGRQLAYQDDTISGTGLQNPAPVTNFYYWVVAKRSNPTATGPFSNGNAGAVGWAVGQGHGIIPMEGLHHLTPDFPLLAVPGGAASAWVHVQGSSAAGAGGGGNGDLAPDQTGGGGGGQGATVTGLMAVAAGSKFRLVSVPEADPGPTAAHSHGADGPVTKLQYSALGTFADTIDVVTCAAPEGGKYVQVPGPYLGGAGASATVHAVLTESYVYDGAAGFPNAQQVGGESGYSFGFGKGARAIYGGSNPTTSNFGGANAGLGHAGGGADYNRQAAALASGCPGVRGGVIIVFYE